VAVILAAYFPSAIKTPMAIAKIPMRMPSPLKLRLSNCISPVKMNQIDNKSMPRFLVILIDMWKTPFSEKVKGFCKVIDAFRYEHMPESLRCQQYYCQ
jgi:hypothetical protein